jgi:hypothetical protein
VFPHISSVGRKLTQTAGRSGCPKSAHRKSASNWTQRTPAGFPSGIPGIGDEILGAMQHAPHCGRQFIYLEKHSSIEPWMTDRTDTENFITKAS